MLKVKSVFLGYYFLKIHFWVLRTLLIALGYPQGYVYPHLKTTGLDISSVTSAFQEDQTRRQKQSKDYHQGQRHRVQVVWLYRGRHSSGYCTKVVFMDVDQERPPCFSKSSSDLCKDVPASCLFWGEMKQKLNLLGTEMTRSLLWNMEVEAWCCGAALPHHEERAVYQDSGEKPHAYRSREPEPGGALDLSAGQWSEAYRHGGEEMAPVKWY